MQLRTRGITYKPKVNCEDLLLNNGESNHLEPAGIGRKMQNGHCSQAKAICGPTWFVEISHKE
jgi:hypothetical protein